MPWPPCATPRRTPGPRRGENAPKRPRSPTRTRHRRRRKSVKETRHNLDKAATALDNRKAQAERDKALAEEVGRDAAKQQQARDQIDTQRQGIGQDGRQGKRKTDPKDAKDRNAKAANDLGKAHEEFADTQRRIGENAKEIAKQQEVANKPLREGAGGGLEAAEAAGRRRQDGQGHAAEGQDGDEPKTAPRARQAKTQGKARTGKRPEPKPGEGKAGQPKNGANSARGWSRPRRSRRPR